MNESTPFQNQLLATKFYVPVASGPLISRPRLNALLQESLKQPLTLVSAPAGFGKTTLLSVWAKSLPTGHPRLAWVSLDEDDNEPQLFWSSILSVLNRQQPERFTPVLKSLQSSQPPPVKYLLAALINLLAESTEHFLLILDDYHVITEQQVHTTFSYLVEHLPPQFHIILSTRAEPLLPFPLLRSRGQVLEIRTDQLRCTTEETEAFFHQVIGIQLPDETIREVTARTEGWLVGLQLLGLSLREQGNPLTLVQEVSGDQRYILDYLTEEVLRQQPQDVQMFLLSTCILEQLNSSLCDAVLEQTGSQQMLERLEQANLFIVSLDSKRQWYRYHALFVEALHYRLEQTHADLVPILHHRASLWYAEHNQTTQAILHAFSAHQWQWAVDLIERKSLQLMTYTWGPSHHRFAILQDWLKQLPIEVMASRPRLCLACAQMLYLVAPLPMLDAWFNAAEAKLKTQISDDVSPPILTSQARQEQEDLLGEMIAWHAYMKSFQEEGEATLSLCQQALSHLSAGNALAHAPVAWAQLMTYYTSSANDAAASLERGLHGSALAQTAKQPAVAIAFMGTTARFMLGAGRLHEAYQLTQQAILLGRQTGGPHSPDVGWPSMFQAEILREWNQLDTAHSLAQEAIELCRQTPSIVSLAYLPCGYAVLLRVLLSNGDYEAACSTLQQIECINMHLNRPISLYMHSFFTTIDQVRLWLACGELKRATRWAEEFNLAEWHGTPFAREREEVACVRIHLAKAQPTLALQRLEPVLQRATRGRRWGHVIEIRLLQALAHQMGHEETKAIDALSEAIRLAEPEGYIRSFVD
ncbi:MAG TPA: LuxR family transcriptional regulator, partial [Ktedonobacteraceae bacterium]|nr:LuxR family transcriptional regulator [Ktedonobacteraceae bacterium]